MKKIPSGGTILYLKKKLEIEGLIFCSIKMNVVALMFCMPSQSEYTKGNYCSLFFLSGQWYQTILLFWNWICNKNIQLILVLFIEHLPKKTLPVYGALRSLALHFLKSYVIVYSIFQYNHTTIYVRESLNKTYRLTLCTII